MNRRNFIKGTLAATALTTLVVAAESELLVLGEDSTESYGDSGLTDLDKFRDEQIKDLREWANEQHRANAIEYKTVHYNNDALKLGDKFTIQGEHKNDGTLEVFTVKSHTKQVPTELRPAILL